MTTTTQLMRSWLALLCALLLVPGDTRMFAQQAPPAAAPAQEAMVPPEQLDSLVAPIALYPDPLLSQTLVASTYPLEVIQLQQWLAKNKGLKDKALEDALKKQDWDPSIQAMAVLPDAVKQLAENIKWTTDLGNAFLAQQQDVMEAVQRMRQKAQKAGTLTTTEQQKVETKVVETKTVIVVEQANPQIVYVPTYNPVVVYGPPVYPYPPIVYPPPPPPGAYVATAASAFGVGMMVGAAYHGGWGYHCGWGSSNTVIVNHNNNYVNHSNTVNRVNNVNNVNRANTGNSTWQHNAQHRGAAPYSSQATANKYGGTARGTQPANRQAMAGQGQARAGGAQAGSMNRGAGSGGASGGNMGASRGSGGAQAGNMNRGSGSGAARAGNMSASRGSSGSHSAFGGASGGMSGNWARASSQRGSYSMSSSRGGASRGGASRGGGGRRR